MVTLKDLKLQDETQVSIVNINGVEVEVKKYVGVQDKMAIINIAIQESLDSNGMIVKPIAEAMVSLYTVYIYSNIVFSKDEKDSQIDTYNLLEKTGVIDAIVGAIPKVEYETLIEAYEAVVDDHFKYRTSSASAIIEIFESLPKMIDSMNTGLEEFNLENLQVLNGVMKGMGGNEAAVTDMLLGQK